MFDYISILSLNEGVKCRSKFFLHVEKNSWQNNKNAKQKPRQLTRGRNQLQPGSLTICLTDLKMNK